MTREENLYWIDQEIRTWENECQSEHPIKEALYAARKALEQKPCEDAVSRKSVIAIIQNHWWNCRDIDKLVNKLPPVTPQEPRKRRETECIQAIFTEALEEGIRCAMCTNAMKSEKGCDGGCMVDTKMYNKVMTEINSRLLRKLPKEGHWIKEESPYGWDGHSYQCSECGRSIHLDTEMEDLEDYPYCHCGADMREVKE